MIVIKYKIVKVSHYIYSFLIEESKAFRSFFKITYF